MQELKYFTGFTIPAASFAAIWWPEYLCFAGVLYTFGVIPLVETILRPNPVNHDEQAEPALLSSRLYDWLLYAMVPVQCGLLGLFLYQTAYGFYTPFQLLGMTGSMGMCCGILGINIAHELGHRTSRFERLLAQILLLTSLYMHFTIEHNRGHHKWVATSKDPATARRNETLYRFWLRCVPGVFRSAWNYSCTEARNRRRSIWGPGNEVLCFAVIEISLVATIGIFLGPIAMLCFLGAALTGILELETVNYIEHYGLTRTETSAGKYERVQPWHSWNSDHVLGRIMLFELTRHADHHYSASRKFQILRHMPDGPQLPVGYPAAMLVSLIPPLWFRLVHNRLDATSRQQML